MPNNYDNVKNNSCLRKTRLQIIFGTVLVMAAAAMLYGGGPWIAQQMVDAAKAAG